MPTLPGFASHPADVPPEVAEAESSRLATPFPLLRRLSLVCEVGGTWYQGGPNTEFRTGSSGEVVLFINDPQPDDNAGGWTVTLEVTPPPASPPASPAARRLSERAVFADPGALATVPTPLVSLNAANLRHGRVQRLRPCFRLL